MMGLSLLRYELLVEIRDAKGKATDRSVKWVSPQAGGFVRWLVRGRFVERRNETLHITPKGLIAIALWRTHHEGRPRRARIYRGVRLLPAAPGPGAVVPPTRDQGG